MKSENRSVSFIGIGAQKCATTWLHGALDQFPDVFTSNPKELDFFSSYFDRGYEWYERHFADAGQRLWRGEISPSYLVDADAPARVAAYNDAMRILVVLRDPVERAFSNHLHEVRAGHVTGRNIVFEAAVENNPLYIGQGRYAEHLGRWADNFGRENIHVSFQEDIRVGSAAEAGKVAAFLGIAMPDAFVQRRANESIDYKNRTIGMLFWRLGRLGRRSGLGAAIERLKSAPLVRELRRSNQVDMRHAVPQMLPATEQRLTEVFRDQVAALEKMLGRPMPWQRFR